MRLISVKIIAMLTLLSLATMVFFSGRFPLMEGKNIINPYIDTQFAVKYNPDKFDKITVGMPESEIIKILGKPLYKGNGYKDTLNVNYHYTMDGKLLKSTYDSRTNAYDDFAWYDSTLEIDKKGKVIAIYKGWCHD